MGVYTHGELYLSGWGQVSMAGMNAGSKISSARGGLEDEVRAQECG